MSDGGKKTLRSQTREVVYRVFYYFKNESGASDTLESVKCKTSIATGISVRTIERIVREGDCSASENNGKPQFSTPGKKRPRKSSLTADFPEYKKTDLRHIVHEFHKTEGNRVTVAQLNQKIRTDLDWHGSNETLRVLLHNMGFRWRRTQNNRKVLIERHDIRSLRISYLEKIKYFRSQNTPIVYLDETYLHSGHTSSKNWTDDSTKGLFANMSKGQRLIIIHAGWEKGFLPGCLLMFKSGTKSGDYHSEMNSGNYGKWLENMLIPNLPRNSVIVIDNAPYHNVQTNPAPSSNSKKADMVRWLTDRNINFDPNSLKPKLYEIIKNNKKRHVTYKFDNLLRSHGHTVLRLPPYHPDLNPIELIWATVKHNVGARNVTFKLDDARMIAEEEFSKITPEDWKKRCDHVIKVEDKYMEHEVFVDNLSEVEPLIINLQDSSDSDCDSD